MATGHAEHSAKEVSPDRPSSGGVGRDVGGLDLLGSTAGNAAVSRLLGAFRPPPPDVPVQRARNGGCSARPEGGVSTARSQRLDLVLPKSSAPPIGIAPSPTLQRSPSTASVAGPLESPSNQLEQGDRAVPASDVEATEASLEEVTEAAPVVPAALVNGATSHGEGRAAPRRLAPSRPALRSLQHPAGCLQRRSASRPGRNKVRTRTVPTPVSGARAPQARAPPLATADHLPIQRSGCGEACACGPCSEDEDLQAATPAAAVQRACAGGATARLEARPLVHAALTANARARTSPSTLTERRRRPRPTRFPCNGEPPTRTPRQRSRMSRT